MNSPSTGSTDQVASGWLWRRRRPTIRTVVASLALASVLVMLQASSVPVAVAPRSRLPVDGAIETEGGKAEARPHASVRYLGAAGVSIRVGDDHILTAPFFSNPGTTKMLLGHIASDESRFPGYLDDLVADAQALLVGHAHYDHLMDVPAVSRRMPENAVVFGSRTAKNILAGAPAMPLKVEAVNDRAGTPTVPGAWIDIGDGTVRIMAIKSGHAPHFAGMRFFDGTVDEPLKELPERAGGWKLGLPLSYVIDFLEPDSLQPRFRVFFQDAATDPPDGFPPPLGDDKAYDLAVLCVASFHEVRDHPEAILEELEPRAVLLTHWEDFFRPQSEPVRPVPGTNVDRFVKRLRAVLPEHTPYWMPDPGETIELPVE